MAASLQSFTSSPSKRTLPIAGLVVNIYGLDEIPSKVKTVACLWLLHPRLSKQIAMEPFAAATIRAWNETLRSDHTAAKGLIVVTFDQRNHGTRLVDKASNDAWAQGNPRHAQDMFSTYQGTLPYISPRNRCSNFEGTAADTSQLITYLPAYAFPDATRTVSFNMVMGVSLGGHAAWHCVMQDPRITTAVIVIGCADYRRLMAGRAATSKLETWTASVPHGSTFFGSKDFPPSLVDAVNMHDPTALLTRDLRNSDQSLRQPTQYESKTILPRMQSLLRGKRILNLAGADDNLVPYSCSEPFLTWLKLASAHNQWAQALHLEIQDEVFPGVGHAMDAKMAEKAIEFLCASLNDGRLERTSNI